MNKKILIVSLFATLMLLAPMTSVVGVISKNTTSDNQPPNPPRIYGPHRGKVGVAYAFTFVTTDPDGDNVSYYVDWDDGTSTGWTHFYPSGLDCLCSHTWTKKGIYLIRCKANDTHGAESDWAEFYGFRVRENKTVTYVTVDNQPSVEDCDVSKNSLEITEEVEKSEVNEKNDYDCLPCALKEKIEKTKGKNVLFNNIKEHVENIIKKTSTYPPSHPICQMLSLLYGFCLMFGRIICAATIGVIYALICQGIFL